ncbi:anti-sigma factor [Microbacterium hominis]|uniref:anti-sigma factor n=1 Tax=Microbacterium hominis TaxID=162426 RepID=UPI0007685B78|nr:anti-sigma factor [Microbacterium hominis]KXC07415.1 hypothetical protein MhomT_00110 [Microbacterium hominis]
MNTNTLARGLVGLAAAAALVLVPTLGASAAIVPTVGSTHDVYLIDVEEGTPITEGASLKWNKGVLAAPEASDTDFNSYFSIPAGADSVVKFISPRGKEADQSQWNAYAALGFTPNPGIQLPNLQPSSLTSNGQGSPSGIRSVFTAAGSYTGGEYSLGIAFLKNGGSQVVETDFVFVDVVATSDFNQGTWTFSTPHPAVAPTVTTQPADASVILGNSATFTAAASGSPAPAVQWQSSTDSGANWADVAGATSASLTVANTTLANNAARYRAVFTNTAGSVTTSAATLTVIDSVPTEPTGSDAHKVTITDPADGAKTITVPAGVANANKTLQAWAWSTPTSLGQVTTDANGDALVNISSLPAGAHTVALTLPADPDVLAWGTFTVPVASYPDKTATADVQATVTASDLWSLNAEKSAINFGNVARSATAATQSLGKVTVVDDRNVLKGWDLNVGWTSFTNAANDEIPGTALTVTPKAYTGYTLLDGVTLGSTGTKIAQSAAGVSTLTSGALFDADLVFTAPKDAKVGEYHSTLTLTLASK